MNAIVTDVSDGSLAQNAGITPGMRVESLNGLTEFDIIDYLEASAEPVMTLCVVREDGGRDTIELINDFSAPVGLSFESATIDHVRTCANSCLFCFVDQAPKGLRGSLYVKDDDYRLSFLHGNYVTLTNLSRRDEDRIIASRLSPLNVSLHCADPAVRERMMGSPSASGGMSQLGRLAGAGIELNIQLVLCPGINDALVFEDTLTRLTAIAGAVISVSAVPVGLTGHREGLEPLRAFSASEASAVISTVRRYREKALRECSKPLFHASDEFFLIAGEPVPEAEYYGEWDQYDNGVGMARTFLDALGNPPSRGKGTRESVSLVTGLMGSALFAMAMPGLTRKGWTNLSVLTVENTSLGGGVGASGLLFGNDICAALSASGAARALVPSNCLNGDGLFLDGMSLDEAMRRTGARIIAAASDGSDFFAAVRRAGHE